MACYQEGDCAQQKIPHDHNTRDLKLSSTDNEVRISDLNQI